ncbi:MAG: hypothetical protein AB3N20_02420 [Rhizobiaceae bacterium]
MKRFRASVQYNDYVGTAAADRGDNEDIFSLFTDKGYVKENELPFAIEIWSGENHGGPADELSVSLTVVDLSKHGTLDEYLNDQKRPPLRTINTKMSNNDFFGLFKRFSVVLLNKGYDEHIAHNEYEVNEIYPDE